MLIPFGVFSAAGAGGGGGGTPAYELIATTLIASNTSTITLSSIPSTYKHLQIRWTGRTTTTDSTARDLFMRVNGWTTSVYNTHYMWGNSGSVQSGNYGTSDAIVFQNAIENADISDIFGAGIIDFANYSNTTSYKTARMLSGYKGNNQDVRLSSGLFMKTNAIEQISFYIGYSGSPYNFIAGTRFSIYGIKGD